jgi:YggT family protein
MAILANLVNLLFMFYILVLVARSFLPLMGISLYYHPVGQWVYRLTEPLLRPIRERMPPSGMLDWSPTVAVIALIILRQIVLSVLFGF